MKNRIYTLRRGSIMIFYNTCYSLAASDTSRHNSIFLVQSLHVVNKLNSQFTTGAAERMTQCNSAAVDVDNIGIDTQFPYHRQRLRSKGFIQFHQVDITQTHACLTQDLRHCFYGTDAHDPWMHAGAGAGYQSREWFQAELLHHLLAHDDDKRGAIAGLGRVAGRNATTGSKHRLQFRQC